MFRIIILSFLIICTGLSSCSIKPKDNSNPNIVVILLDDLGYGDFSCYVENNKIKTPHIDQIASEGMRFTDAHSPSSVCTPTRYGIITGRYSWRSRLKEGVLTGISNALIPNSRTTIASMLKSKDYHTTVIGKWHLGWDWAVKDSSVQLGTGWNSTDFGNIDFTKPVKNSPKDLGFDYSYCHAGSLDMAPYVYVENGLITALPDKVTVDTGKYSWWREGPTGADFIHEEVTPHFFEKANTFIEEASTTDQPFFLYLPLPSPHTPILPPDQWQGKSGLNPYGDFIMMIDDYIGILQKTIKEMGIEDNTLLIITSDNGCSPAAGIKEMVAMGHLPNSIYRGHKADIFEGGHRVPLIAKWPKIIKKGALSDHSISLTDLLATFAEITEYEIAENEAEDSYSFLSILKKATKQNKARESIIHHSINGSFAIRKGDWKLIMCPGSGGWSKPVPSEAIKDPTLPEFQLYNLLYDPSERRNSVLEHPELASELKSLLIEKIINGRSTPGVKQINDSLDFEWKQLNFISDN
jgi:arylsulfatase A-like enzyme